MNNIFLAINFIIGCSIGSFVHAIGFRISQKNIDPKSMSWKDLFLKPSRCCSCNNKIKSIDLIPIVSYILRRGKCRFCQSYFSGLYVGFEILMGVAFTFAYFQYSGNVINLVTIDVIFAALIGVLIIDLYSFYINDTLLVAVFGCGIILFLNSFMDGFGMRLLFAFILSFSVLLLAVIMSKILKKDAMGFGDVKLLFVLGVLIDPMMYQFWIMAMGIIGIITALLMRVCPAFHLLKDDPEVPEGAFPFGPAIIISNLVIFCLTN